MSGPSMLTGRVVVVTGGDTALGQQLALGLTDQGATVGTAARATSRAEANTHLSDVVGSVGPVDVVVHADVDPAALVPQPLADTDEGDWERRGEAVLRNALFWCQAAFTALRERGGSVVLVTPAISLVGAAGFVPYLAAAEGMRTLAKCAARQWGRHGITVNCAAPAAALVWPDAGRGPIYPDPPALGRLPDARTELASVVAMLASGAITGATVTVDGGVLMLP